VLQEYSATTEKLRRYSVGVGCLTGPCTHPLAGLPSTPPFLLARQSVHKGYTLQRMAGKKRSTDSTTPNHSRKAPPSPSYSRAKISSRAATGRRWRNSRGGTACR